MMQNYVDPYSLCCLFTIIVSVRFHGMVVGYYYQYFQIAEKFNLKISSFSCQKYRKLFGLHS